MPVTQDCEICKSDSRLWAIISGYAHFRCVACEHLFVFPRPSQEVLDKFYQAGTYYYAAEQQLSRLRNEARFRSKMLVKLATRFCLPLALLDVGCASGIFLKEAQAIGWQVSGTDRSEATAAQALKKVGCPIYIGLLEKLSILGAPYPVVTAWEVLEHSVYPRIFFRALAENVRPGGLLAISTPLGNGLIARILGLRFPMLTPPEHLSLFSRKSLILLAREYGFSPVAYRSFSNMNFRTLQSGFCKLLFQRSIGQCGFTERFLVFFLALLVAWVPPLIDAAGLGTEMEIVFWKDNT